MNAVERQVVLVVADISGYTKFIFSNKKEIGHSQIIIRELLTTLLDQVKPPLQLARIEGDAIFLYALKDAPGQSWNKVSDSLVVSMMALFKAFGDKVSELTIHKICNCTACVNIEQLKLKAVVDSGPAILYSINDNLELSGTGPIIVHRLLKNSVEADEYILLTESAYHDLTLPDGKVEQGEETYDDIGTIKTLVYYPPELEPYVPLPGAKPPEIFIETLRAEVAQEYARVAKYPENDFHFHTGRRLAGMLEYRDEWLEGLPEEAIESFAGTGNPFKMGGLYPNNRVVDAGCGAGLDSIIAANMVGDDGEVIGVDMTDAMIDKAMTNAQATRAKNVSFKRGFLEDLPVEDEWADVIISNGAINLAPDKDEVFRELNRVLKPGGLLQVADILVEKPIPDSAKQNIDLWAA